MQYRRNVESEPFLRKAGNIIQHQRHHAKHDVRYLRIARQMIIRHAQLYDRGYHRAENQNLEHPVHHARQCGI